MGSGPLDGIKIIEIAGIGPGPFASMLLADMGAEVLRVDRAQAVNPARFGKPNPDVLNRGRKSIALDLKHPEGVATLLRLVESADAILEGFRPGVMERLGLGPDVLLDRNPRLVYGRMTGFGQEGPMAHAAGHDINYIAMAGALEPMGRKGEKPYAPLNLVGDFGGGGMFLAFGVVCALLERGTSGKGQVVDAAMVDGASILMAFFHGMKALGGWPGGRGENILDSGAHFYETYETSDAKYVSVGSIEPQFYAQLVELSGLGGDGELPQQMDREGWPRLTARLTEIFKTKTRAEWCEIMEGSDVCFAPVLSLDEAPDHPHNIARQGFVEIEGLRQPAPAPRFSRTPASVDRPPAHAGQHTDEGLADWGFDAETIAKLREAKAIV